MNEDDYEYEALRREYARHSASYHVRMMWTWRVVWVAMLAALMWAATKDESGPHYYENPKLVTVVSTR